MTVQSNNVLQLLLYHDCNSDRESRRQLFSECANFPYKIHTNYVCVEASSQQGETSFKSSPNLLSKVVEAPDFPKQYLECIQLLLIYQTLCYGQKDFEVGKKSILSYDQTKKLSYFPGTKIYALWMCFFFSFHSYIMHVNYNLSHVCWAKSLYESLYLYEK